MSEDHDYELTVTLVVGEGLYVHVECQSCKEKDVRIAELEDALEHVKERRFRAQMRAYRLRKRAVEAEAELAKMKDEKDCCVDLIRDYEEAAEKGMDLSGEILLASILKRAKQAETALEKSYRAFDELNEDRHRVMAALAKARVGELEDMNVLEGTELKLKLAEAALAWWKASVEDWDDHMYEVLESRWTARAAEEGAP